MQKRIKTDSLITESELSISSISAITAYKNDLAYNRHLASIVDSSDDTIISESLDGTIKSWNNGGRKMFGYTALEAVGKNVSFIIPPDHINEEKDILERLLQNKIIGHYETVRNKKNGKQIYVSLTVSPIKDDAGNIIGVSKIAKDITHRKKFEAALIIANKELLYQHGEKENRAAELVIANKELDFQSEEKENRAAELVIANKELLFQNEEKEKRAAELVLANKELLYQNEEKEKRAGELVIANKELLYQNEEKEKRAAELVIANKELIYQNEEKNKQAIALVEANKELESFTYSVSHDLRTPLRAITGFTQILLEDYKEQLDDDAQDVLNEVIANSNKMGELIDNLLDFSRITKQHVSMCTINVKHMVDVVIAELKPMYPNRINVSIKNLENINGDRNMLKQVFINLISNAFKYTGKKDEAMIEIGCYRKEDDCIYYVKDNGAGFDMKYYDKLFGVFQRLHSTSEFEGTGVGLAIIQKIVIKHGGKVWAEGKVNEGACFYVSLPIREE